MVFFFACFLAARRCQYITLFIHVRLTFNAKRFSDQSNTKRSLTDPVTQTEKNDPRTANFKLCTVALKVEKKSCIKLSPFNYCFSMLLHFQTWHLKIEFKKQTFVGFVFVRQLSKASEPQLELIPNKISFELLCSFYSWKLHNLLKIYDLYLKSNYLLTLEEKIIKRLIWQECERKNEKSFL